MVSLKEIIKKSDFFSQPVKLLFQKRFDFNTISGGMVSIGTLVFLLAYGIFNTQKISSHFQLLTTSLVQGINIEDLGIVNYNETNIKFITHLDSSYIYQSNNFTVDELQLFLNIYFLQEYYEEGILFQRNISMRQCLPQDFGSDSRSIQEFDTFYGNFILCPDFNQSQMLVLSSNKEQTITNKIILKIDACDNKTQQCASNEDFKEFESDLLIKIWKYEERIDFQQFKGKPTQTYSNVLCQIYPSAFNSVSQYFQFSLRFNEIHTYDEVVNYGQISQYVKYYDTNGGNQFFKRKDISDNIATIIFSLDQSKVNHKRISYGLIDLLRDIGGMNNILRTIFRYIIVQISDFSYSLQIISALYIAYTKDTFLFKQQANNKRFNKKENNQFRYMINLSYSDKFHLYFSQFFFKCIYWKKFRKMKKMLSEGKSRILKDLDIISIIKKLRKHNEILKRQDRYNEYKQNYYENDKYILNLDSSENQNQIESNVNQNQEESYNQDQESISEYDDSIDQTNSRQQKMKFYSYISPNRQQIMQISQSNKKNNFKMSVQNLEQKNEKNKINKKMKNVMIQQYSSDQDEKQIKIEKIDIQLKDIQYKRRSNRQHISQKKCEIQAKY